MNKTAANVSFGEIDSDRGHDAFLSDESGLFKIVDGILTGIAGRRPAGDRP